MNRSFRIACGIFIFALCIFALHGRVRASDVAVMAMSPHMDMTVKTPLAPGDRERAGAILSALKNVMAKYQDVRAAEAGGYAQWQPQLHLADAHFTNMTYAKEAWSGRFDASHPTSLMYRRNGNGWILQGAMYTAPPSASEEQLNAEVPTSIGQWHRHTNVCMGPAGTSAREYFGHGAKFGLAGSIADEASCTGAGGRWKAQVYGWMLHVWPMQPDPAKVWMLHPDGDPGMHMEMQMHR